MSSTSSKAVIVLLAVGSMIGVAGCDDDDVGVIRQSWTINGSTDPQNCSIRGAAQMRVIAIDQERVVRSTQFAACGDFNISIPLDPGFYDMAATFISADGRAVSRTQTISDVPVADDEETFINLDFVAVTFEPPFQ
jgi:hypothetical protein